MISRRSPTFAACGGGAEEAPAPEPEPEPTVGAEEPVAAEPDPLAIPQTKPADWDAIAFNKERGNAGAIPESYLPSINGPDGDTQHLGKHLPYLAEVDEGDVPAGMIALMWGDPAMGYARHPNAPPTEDNPDGHWYDWIRIRKATEGEAEEAESHYRGWPEVEQPEDGGYAVMGGGSITADGGKNTIYLAKLPADVSPGDTIRVHAHCLTHGEYVDFVVV